MKKIIITLSSILVLAAAGSIGYTYYMTHPSVEYTTENFSFKVPKGFKLLDDDEIGLYDMMFSGPFHSRIYFDDCTYNCTVKAYTESSEDKAKAFDIGSELECYADHTTNSKSEPLIQYVAGTDTRFLDIKTSCSAIKGFLSEKAIKNIMKTVKYTSDFRIADLPEEYDYPYFTIKTGHKYFAADNEINNDKSLIDIKIRYTEGDDYFNSSYPAVFLSVSESGKTDPPSEMLDKRYEKFKSDSEYFFDPVRGQKELFGIKCEYLCFKQNFGEDGDIIKYEQYGFVKGDKNYLITAEGLIGKDESAISEMLDCITIKNR